jgi:hypothetical protein
MRTGQERTWCPVLNTTRQSCKASTDGGHGMATKSSCACSKTLLGTVGCARHIRGQDHLLSHKCGDGRMRCQPLTKPCSIETSIVLSSTKAASKQDRLYSDWSQLSQPKCKPCLQKTYTPASISAVHVCIRHTHRHTEAQSTSAVFVLTSTQKCSASTGLLKASMKDPSCSWHS